MNITEKLRQQLLVTRPNLNSLELSLVKPENVYNDMNIRGRIAEALVYKWLSSVPVDFINEFPETPDGAKWKKTPHGIVVSSGFTKREFDFVFNYEGSPFIAEVKSLDINGITSKIPESISIAQDYFQTDVSMILFFPIYSNKVNDKIQIEEQFPQVKCVDIGYKKKQLKNCLIKYHKMLAESQKKAYQQ